MEIYGSTRKEEEVGRVKPSGEEILRTNYPKMEVVQETKVLPWYS